MVLYFELKQSRGETNDLQLSRTPNEIINDRAHAGAFCPGGATVITTTSSTCVYRRMFARAQSIKDTEQRIVVDGEVGHSTYLLVFHDISMYFSCCTFNHPQVKLEHMDCPGSRYKFSCENIQAEIQAFGHGDSPRYRDLIDQPGFHPWRYPTAAAKGGNNLSNALPDQLSPEAEGFDGEELDTTVGSGEPELQNDTQEKCGRMRSLKEIPRH